MIGRSFNQHDRRKLGCCAFVICFVVGVTVSNIFEPYILNLQLSMGVTLTMLMKTKETIKPQQSYNYKLKEAKIICNFTRKRSDICEMNGDIRIPGNSSTIFFVSPTSQSHNDHTSNSTIADINSSWYIKLYARKIDWYLMKYLIRNLTIKTAHVSEGYNINNIPECTKNYSIPGIVFSTGGYAGNQFHAFVDILIPLFLTSIQFNGEVILVLSDKNYEWIKKHQPVLQKLSNYDPIDMDQENIGVVCFPRIIVGLNATDKELGVDPSQSSYTLKDFRKLLRSAYSLKTDNIKNDDHRDQRSLPPRLLVISRKRTRRFINGGEIAATAKSLGFDAVVQETSSNNESEVSKFFNSFDVVVGVHGAGLTNMVYLPDNALVIQVIPWGDMEWVAKKYFEDAAREMNLHYLKYKISPNESSLIQHYPLDHEVFQNPAAIRNRGWMPFRYIFLDKQDIKLDMRRFRQTLLEAHHILQS